jgi:hypothetical protein
LQGNGSGILAVDATLWRTLEEIGPEQRARIATARARTRREVWTLIKARHGRITVNPDGSVRPASSSSRQVTEVACSTAAPVAASRPASRRGSVVVASLATTTRPPVAPLLAAWSVPPRSSCPMSGGRFG